MFRTKSQTDVLKEQVKEGTSTAAERAAALKEQWGPAAEQAKEIARQRAAQAKDAAAHGIEVAAPKVEDAVNNLGPKVDTARDKIVDELIPRVAEAVEALAAGAAAARVTAMETADRAPGAYAVLTGEAVATKPRKKRRGLLLITLGLAAAGAAAYAASRRSGPKEDPWAIPTEDTYSAGNRSVSERAAGLASAAKEKATQAKNAASERIAGGSGSGADASVPATNATEAADLTTKNLAGSGSKDAWSDAKEWAEDTAEDSTAAAPEEDEATEAGTSKE